MKQDFRRKKLQRRNQRYPFLGDRYRSGDNLRSQTSLEETEDPSILENDFLSRIHPYIFTSILPKLFERSNETRIFFQALILTSHLP